MRHLVERSPLSFALSSAQILLGCTTTLWATLCLSFTPPTVAQQVAQQSVPTPPDQGNPTGRQRGGASRGDCVEYQDLTALVPVVDGVVWSQTQSPTPEFFFHVPEALTAEIPLELVVQDSQDNYVFQRQFSVEAPPGILTVPTANAGAELTPGEAYSWTFSIYCDAARPSASVSVFGTIQRVADSETNVGSIESDGDRPAAMPLALARQYAAEGLWHEAMELTLDVYAENPNDVGAIELLEDLLEEAGLSEISPPVATDNLSQPPQDVQ